MLDEFLAYLGDALDKPGRAVRGVLGGRPEEALAFLPFSDSLGLTDQSNMVTGSELARQYAGTDPDSLSGKAAGFAADLFTDPTTYIGAGLGARLGKWAGRGLEGAAAARGPGYKTTLESLLETISSKAGARTEDAASRLGAFAQHPGFEQALSEIPTGSQYLGHGTQGIAFQGPTGDVTRLSMNNFGAATRPIDQGILPTTRIADIGGGEGTSILRTERTPFAGQFANPEGRLSPESVQELRDLHADLGERGINFFDRSRENVGMFGGRPVVLDPGAVRTSESFAGQMAPSTTVGNVNPFTRAVLDALGGQSAMQRSLAAGRNAPRYQVGGYFAGGGAGGLLGGGS